MYVIFFPNLSSIISGKCEVIPPPTTLFLFGFQQPFLRAAFPHSQTAQKYLCIISRYQPFTKPRFLWPSQDALKACIVTKGGCCHCWGGGSEGQWCKAGCCTMSCCYLNRLNSVQTLTHKKLDSTLCSSHHPGIIEYQRQTAGGWGGGVTLQ